MVEIAVLPCQSDQLGDMHRGTIGTSTSLVLELEDDDDSLNSFSDVVVDVSSLVSDFVSDLTGLVDG